MSSLRARMALANDEEDMYMVQSIVKRDGRVVLYDERKIAQAIMKAMEASGTAEPATDAAKVANAVGEFLESHYGTTPPPIEGIQDAVERELMHQGYDGAAKKYILYRNERTRKREMNSRLMKIFDELTFADSRASDMKRDNANIDGDTAMGTMLKYGCESAKDYYSKYLLTPEQRAAHIDGYIHIHDFDFYALTTTCCQIDLLKLFKGGVQHRTWIPSRAERHPKLRGPCVHRDPEQPERPARGAEHRQFRLRSRTGSRQDL